MRVSDMYELVNDYPELQVFAKVEEAEEVKGILSKMSEDQLSKIKLKIYDLRNSNSQSIYPIVIFLSTSVKHYLSIDLGSGIFLPCYYIDITKI